MFHHQAVIGVQSFKRNHQVIVCIFQQCVALIVWVHVLQMLWSIIYCSSHHCLRSITTQDWCLWVLRSAGERDRHPGCTLWTLTNLEPNTQHTRLPMQSTGNCALVVWRGALPIEIWTTDRQTRWKVRYLCQSRPEWEQPVLSNSGNLCHKVTRSMQRVYRLVWRVWVWVHKIMVGKGIQLGIMSSDVTIITS